MASRIGPAERMGGRLQRRHLCITYDVGTTINLTDDHSTGQTGGHMAKRTGSQIIWECLVHEGVTTVFGYPGGAILPAYDAMLDYPIRHVLVRHEQGATHMADGYARASGNVGVAMATSGPGATNLVTGIATAMMDSSPMVCITGQVPSKLIGYDAFQETDIGGITLPITKHNYLVTHVEDIMPAIKEAFHLAKSGRPGPVGAAESLSGRHHQGGSAGLDGMGMGSAYVQDARQSPQPACHQGRPRESDRADSCLAASGNSGGAGRHSKRRDERADRVLRA